jgi:TIR domain-containing protein
MSSAAGSLDGAPPSVFISYRREDTAAHAGRLYDAMVARFGERNVFMDVDIAPGVNFVERITEAVSGCLVLIVVMGPRWASVEDEDGAARLANPDDFVRLEVETALRRDEVTPIPVLVSGARMPKRDQLPTELHPITYRNALELSDTRWSYDVGRLNATLDVLLADTIETRAATPTMTPTIEPPTPAPPAEATPPETPIPATLSAPPSPPGLRLALEGMLVAGVAAFAARMVGEEIPKGTEAATKAASVTVTRVGVWAVVAAVLLAWLAIRTGRKDAGRLAVRGVVGGAFAGLLGGLLWAVPVQLILEVDAEHPAAAWIQVGSIAVTGGLVGRLIGSAWQPPQPGTGLLCGAFAGAAVQLATMAVSWDSAKPVEDVSLCLAFSAAAIAGLTLAVLSRPRR